MFPIIYLLIKKLIQLKAFISIKKIILFNFIAKLLIFKKNINLQTLVSIILFFY
jgi:hypothetical protein